MKKNAYSSSPSISLILAAIENQKAELKGGAYKHFMIIDPLLEIEGCPRR
jgi:hypothetical protein